VCDIDLLADSVPPSAVAISPPSSLAGGGIPRVFVEALEGIADRLNNALIKMLGDRADWGNNVGSMSPPIEWTQQPDFINEIWAAREEANSVLVWVDENQ
jgi:hypothetical protein